MVSRCPTPHGSVPWYPGQEARAGKRDLQLQPGTRQL